MNQCGGWGLRMRHRAIRAAGPRACCYHFDEAKISSWGWSQQVTAMTDEPTVTVDEKVLEKGLQDILQKIPAFRRLQGFHSLGSSSRADQAGDGSPNR